MHLNYDTLTFHIGTDDEGQPLAQKKWKAHFYWKKGNEMMDSKVFDKAELAVEIKRRQALGEDMTVYENAYAKL